MGLSIYDSRTENEVIKVKYKIRLKVKELLEEKNLTQKELAIRSGIRESTISDIVRGSRTVINFEHLAKIMEALKVKRVEDIIELDVSNK